MTNDLLDEAQDVAVAAIDLALDTIAPALDRPQSSEAKSTAADVVTPVDRLAESRILSLLQHRFPMHSFDTEETGAIDHDSPYRWVVDPLDGSHNLLLGIPLCATGITLYVDGVPSLALAGMTHHRKRIVVREQEVADLKDVSRARTLKSAAAVAFQQGYSIDRASSALADVRDALEAGYPRVLYTWSPIVDLFLMVEGSLSGCVVVGMTGYERHCAIPIARALGFDVCHLDGRVVEDGAVPESYVLAWRPHLDGLLDCAQHWFSSSND